MLNKADVVILAVVAASLVVSAQVKAAATGWKVIVKVEARATGAALEFESRQLSVSLPDGSATIEYITDGRAARSVTSGGFFGFDDGTISLAPTGTSPVYVLNPQSRTYYISSAAASSGQPGSAKVSFNATGVFRTILGHRVERVTASYHQTMAVPAGSGRSETKEAGAEFETWCTRDVTVPVAMVTMMGVTPRLYLGSPQFRAACPLALESVVKMSVFPDFEFVSTTQSISKVSGEPAGFFEIPTGYRKVAAGGGSR
jgi:hypothetical protein